MAICPACRKGKLVKFEDTRYCSENCGFVEDIKPIRAQKWLLKIAENDKHYWRREYFDKLPTFIAHESPPSSVLSTAVSLECSCVATNNRGCARCGT